MQVKFNKMKTLFMAATLLALVICPLLAPPKAAAQVYSPSIYAATNLPATVATAARSNQTSVVRVYANRGLSMAWTFNVSSGTSNAVLQLYPSIDGTNYSTVPWTITATATGTTSATFFTNWSPATLTGITSFNVGGITNQNAGTLTNTSVLFNRPSS